MNEFYFGVDQCTVIVNDLSINTSKLQSDQVKTFFVKKKNVFRFNNNYDKD